MAAAIGMAGFIAVRRLGVSIRVMMRGAVTMTMMMVVVMVVGCDRNGVICCALVRARRRHVCERPNPRGSNEHCHHDGHDAAACPSCCERSGHGRRVLHATDQIKATRPLVTAWVGISNRVGGSLLTVHICGNERTSFSLLNKVGQGQTDDPTTKFRSTR
jgi:hypothetical protein